MYLYYNDDIEALLFLYFDDNEIIVAFETRGQLFERGTIERFTYW